MSKSMDEDMSLSVGTIVITVVGTVSCICLALYRTWRPTNVEYYVDLAADALPTHK